MPVDWDEFEADKPATATATSAPGVDWSEFEPEGLLPKAQAAAQAPDGFAAARQQLEDQAALPPANGDELAARNFAARSSFARQLGVPVAPEGETSDSLTRNAGRLAGMLGRGVRNVGGALALQTVDEPELALQQLGVSPEDTQKIRGEYVPEEDVSPIEAGQRAQSVPGQLLSKASYGLLESVPKLAGVTALQAGGVPAPLGAAAMFGTTEEGFSLKDAALAAALPFVGKYSGAIVGAIAKKYGVDTTEALHIWKSAGAMTGAAGYMGLIDESAIQNLPPEQRDQARVDSVAGLIGQSVLGPMGVERENITPKAAEPDPMQGPLFGRSLPRREGAYPPVQGPPLPVPIPRGRPVVPETAPEAGRNVTAVSEVRANGADTLEKVKALFPERGLNNEQARELRDLAFPKGAEPEPAAAPGVAGPAQHVAMTDLLGNGVDVSMADEYNRQHSQEAQDLHDEATAAEEDAKAAPAGPEGDAAREKASTARRVADLAAAQETAPGQTAKRLRRERRAWEKANDASFGTPEYDNKVDEFNELIKQHEDTADEIIFHRRRHDQQNAQPAPIPGEVTGTSENPADVAARVRQANAEAENRIIQRHLGEAQRRHQQMIEDGDEHGARLAGLEVMRLQRVLYAPANSSKPPILPKPPIPGVPGRMRRPVVPESAPEPERNQTVIQEIRAKGARTLNQIKALFPGVPMNNERARALRDQAFPPGDETPPPLPPEGTGGVPIPPLPKGPAGRGGAGAKQEPLEKPEGFEPKTIPEILGPENVHAIVRQPAPKGLTLEEYTKDTAEPLNKRIQTITDGKTGGTIGAYWAAVNDARTAADPVARMAEWGKAARELYDKSREIGDRAEKTGDIDLVMKQAEPAHRGSLIKEGLEAVASFGEEYGLPNSVINAARREVGRMNMEAAAASKRAKAPEVVAAPKAEPAPVEPPKRKGKPTLEEQIAEADAHNKKVDAFNAELKRIGGTVKVGDRASYADQGGNPKRGVLQGFKIEDGRKLPIVVDDDGTKRTLFGMVSIRPEGTPQLDFRTFTPGEPAAPEKPSWSETLTNRKKPEVEPAKPETEWMGKPLSHWKNLDISKLGPVDRQRLAKSLGVTDAPRAIRIALQTRVAEIEGGANKPAVDYTARPKVGDVVKHPDYGQVQVDSVGDDMLTFTVLTGRKAGVKLVRKLSTWNEDMSVAKPASEAVTPAAAAPKVAGGLSPEQTRAEQLLNQDKKALEAGKWGEGTPLSELSKQMLRAKQTEYYDFIAGRTKGDLPDALDHGEMIKEDQGRAGTAPLQLRDFKDNLRPMVKAFREFKDNAAKSTSSALRSLARNWEEFMRGLDKDGIDYVHIVERYKEDFDGVELAKHFDADKLEEFRNHLLERSKLHSAAHEKAALNDPLSDAQITATLGRVIKALGIYKARGITPGSGRAAPEARGPSMPVKNANGTYSGNANAETVAQVRNKQGVHAMELKVQPNGDGTWSVSLHIDFSKTGMGGPFHGDYASREEALHYGAVQLLNFVTHQEGRNDWKPTANDKKAVADIRAALKPFLVERFLAPAKESHSATTEPRTAPKVSREEIGDRPGATPPTDDEPLGSHEGTDVNVLDVAEQKKGLEAQRAHLRRLLMRLDMRESDEFTPSDILERDEDRRVQLQERLAEIEHQMLTGKGPKPRTPAKLDKDQLRAKTDWDYEHGLVTKRAWEDGTPMSAESRATLRERAKEYADFIAERTTEPPEPLARETMLENDQEEAARNKPKPSSPPKVTPAAPPTTGKLTPLMAQHARLKQDAPGALLAIRLGDFYEFFGEDAATAAAALHIAMTKRGDVPMVGVPVHAAEGYWKKLLKGGHKVALAEQVGSVKPGESPTRAVTTVLKPEAAETKPAAKPHWLDSLAKPQQESVYQTMREIRQRADLYGEEERRLRPPQGTIAAGAVGFDSFMQSEARNTFLSELGKGSTPEQAEQAAKQWAREAVEIHNKKRPKDIDWKRWEGTGDSVIETARRQIEQAEKAVAAPKAAQPVDEDDVDAALEEQDQAGEDQGDETPGPAAQKFTGDYTQLDARLKAARAKVIAAQRAHADAMESEIKVEEEFERTRKEPLGSDASRKAYNAKIEARAVTARAEGAVRAAEAEASLARFERETAQYLGKPEAKPGKPTITGKMLKEQKESLLAQLAEAIKAAPEEGSDNITIKVPGDGEFTLANTKGHLKRFRDGAAKGFPSTTGAVGGPGLPSVNAKAAPKLGTPTVADFSKIAGEFTSSDEDRPVLHNAYADGTQIIATDGRQLIRIITDDAPGTPDKPVHVSPDGKVNAEATRTNQFPNYAQVRDDKANLVYGGMDTGDLFHITRQAEVFRNTTIQDASKRGSYSIKLVVNPDRTLGGSMEIEREAFEHNVKPGAVSLGNFNPDYLLNAMGAARKLGNKTVDVYASGDEGPLTFTGKNHESIVMPMRGAKLPTGEYPPVRDSVAKFAKVVGRQDHPRLTPGLGVMEHPESQRTGYAETNSGKFRVTLQDGVIRVQQVVSGKNHRGESETSFKDLGEMPLSEWPEGGKAQIGKAKEISKLDRSGEVEAAGKVRDEVNRLAKQREKLVEEGERRKAMAKIPKGPGIVGMGGALQGELPNLPTIEDQISGKLEPEGPPEESDATAAPVLKSWRELMDDQVERFKGWAGGLAGKTFPRTTAKSKRLGELAARWISSAIAAKPMAEVFAADVIGDSGVDRVHLGAALTEDNLRSIKYAFEEKADEAENRDEIIEHYQEDLGNLAERVQDRDPEAMKEASQIRKEISRLSKLTDEDAARFRAKAARVKSFIGAENFPFRTEDELQAFFADPRVKEVIARHKDLWHSVIEPQYKQAMDLDPEMELPSRGHQTGARINLRAVIEGESSRNAVTTANRGNLLNTFRRKSPFGVEAKGTGEAYHIDYHDLIQNTFRRQLEIANKNAFENALVEAKQAVIAGPGRTISIDGRVVPASAQFPLKRRTIIGEHGSVNQDKKLYINPRLAKEYEIGANVASKPPYGAVALVNKILNATALAGLTDATTHIVNQVSTLATLPGTSGRLLHDTMLAAVPGRMDIWVALGKALAGGFKDNRAQLASLAEIGALREEHEPSGLSRLPGFKQMSGAVHWMDKTTRLALDDTYKRLVKDGIVENSETARREFVNQIGQYNKRAQGWWTRLARDTGLAPFVTAGKTFNALGVRGLTLNPGVKATSYASAAALRANMLVKIAGTLATVGIINYLLTKDKGGGVMGRPGIPIGDIDLGTNDANGRPNRIPLFSMIGPGRGFRVTGARGFIQSRMNGLPMGTSTGAGFRDFANSAVSPWAGPPIKAATLLLTGHPTAFDVARQSKVVPPGESQVWQNAKEVAVQANPVVAGIVRANEPGGHWSDALTSQLPRFLPQPGKSAEMMRDYPGIVRRAQASAYIEDVIGRARKLEPGERRQFLYDSIVRLQSMQDRASALKQFRYRKVL